MELCQVIQKRMLLPQRQGGERCQLDWNQMLAPLEVVPEEPLEINAGVSRNVEVMLVKEVCVLKVSFVVRRVAEVK